MTVNELRSTNRAIVVGIDVGWPKKGFHAVAMREGRLLEKWGTRDVTSIVAWCREINASAVGIDAPCRWSITGRARPAEREMALERVTCFATPSRTAAEKSEFYRWMRAGAELYRLIEPHFPLFDGGPVRAPVCFETFPQAVACSLAGKIVSAKHKRVVRRELLSAAGIDITALTNIDWIDAALCALAAQHFLSGNFKAYGEAEEGFIVVPAARGG